jgi:hypothetical protein
MARRKTEVFSMSFLDCITCAFGAVVLVYTVISAQGGLRHVAQTQTMRAEVSRLEREVIEGQQQLATLRNSIEKTDQENVRTEGLGTRLMRQMEQTKEESADADKQTLAEREAVEQLKTDLKALEEGNRRLEGGSTSAGSPGLRVHGFVGEGDRQYLTGLKVGGERVLILVDASASMLDETLVNVIRMRNMPEARKLLSEKWRRAVSTVEWLVSQVPEQSKFQLYAFNTKAWPIVENSTGRWLSANDADALNKALQGLRLTAPKDGTSLENALAVVNAIDPRPDNVILITDGLPTQGAVPTSAKKTIDGEGRVKLFERAFNKYPRAVPLNVILFPMEGDPSAAAVFWIAARSTRGAFMSPAKDWP